MNNFESVTVVGWETRNWRHHDKALTWCKDYGFRPITKHIFIGELYAKERAEMRRKFETLFIGKTEKCFFATMCKSCFNESMSGMKLKEKLMKTAPFELIQMAK